MWACETCSEVMSSMVKMMQSLEIVVPYGAQFPRPHSHLMGEKLLNTRCAYPADPPRSARIIQIFLSSRAYLDAFFRVLCACLRAIHKSVQHVSVSTRKHTPQVTMHSCSLDCTILSARHEDAPVWMPVKVVHGLTICSDPFQSRQLSKSNQPGTGVTLEARQRAGRLTCV